MAQSFPGYAGLRSRSDEVRLKAARDLQRFVSTELRELPPERYSSSMDDINQSIYSLISSQEVHEKKGGILAIGESGDDKTGHCSYVSCSRKCAKAITCFQYAILAKVYNSLVLYVIMHPIWGVTFRISTCLHP